MCGGTVVAGEARVEPLLATGDNHSSGVDLEVPRGEQAFGRSAIGRALDNDSDHRRPRVIRPSP